MFRMVLGTYFPDLDRGLPGGVIGSEQLPVGNPAMSAVSAQHPVPVIETDLPLRLLMVWGGCVFWEYGLGVGSGCTGVEPFSAPHRLQMPMIQTAMQLRRWELEVIGLSKV